MSAQARRDAQIAHAIKLFPHIPQETRVITDAKQFWTATYSLVRECNQSAERVATIPTDFQSQRYLFPGVFKCTS